MHEIKLSLVAATILSLSACCGVSEQARLSVPASPDYPTIPAEQLQCLSDEAYGALVVRDTMCRERIKTLKDIIRSTHK